MQEQTEILGKRRSIAGLLGLLGFSLAYQIARLSGIVAIGHGRLLVILITIHSTAISGLLIFLIGRLRMARDPVVTLSPEGFHDRRVSFAPVPWEAITGLRAQGSWIVLLQISESARQELPLTCMARFTDWSNRWLGWGGLWINSFGLKANTKELVDLIGKYAPHLRV